MSSIPRDAHYTYEDFKNLPGELRCEIIDGRIYDMTPAPSIKHQQVTGTIYHLVRRHLSSVPGPCRVFVAPADVVLANDQVLQPDVLIVCDRTNIREAAIFGAPDVIFEVLSPATEIKDRGPKMEICERFGVREYYLVQLEPEFVEKYFLTGGSYTRPRVYREEQIFTIEAIGLEICARDLFAL